MIQVTTLFFATLRDRAGVRSFEMEIPVRTSVAEYKIMLIEKVPALADLLGHALVSVNQEYAFDETLILNNAEIALFPPVSGG